MFARADTSLRLEMLSDRSYMRDSYGRTTTSILTWTLCALTAGFLIQIVFSRAFESGQFNNFASFTADGLTRGWVWTFVTYPLLHDNVLYWLANAVTLYFLGRELLPLLGERRFAWFIFAAATLGALAWTPAHLNTTDSLTGATSISCAFLMLFACLHPNRRVSFLLLFFPVTVRPKYVAWTVLALSAIGLVANEIPGDRLNLSIAHSAHLGGMLAALLYYRFVHLREWRTPDGRAEIELPQWLKKSAKTSAAEKPAKYTVNVSTASRADIRAEVDRILDKINSEGFASLTADEKRLLDQARNQITRH